MMDIIYVLQREMLRRCYSTRTIHSYVHCISSFMRFCNKDLKRVTKLDIKNYLDKHIDKGNSGSTINVNLNAIKFVMEEILNKKLMLKFKYSKTPKSIPVFLTREEVKRLFEATNNEKHKLILELIYSAGLRVSEVVNLKLCDLDFSRNMGWVRHVKVIKIVLSLLHNY